MAAGLASLTLTATLSARSAASVESTCARSGSTTLVADGNLYVVVRSAQRRYLFGSSGQPVLSVPEAISLIRALGFTGTNTQLFTRLSRAGIPGATYADAGSISNFTLGCSGTYTATAVVRSDHGAITATRFWLQQAGHIHVVRAFCMPEQWVPARAWVSVSFHVPLGSAPPVFTIDWNHDGKADSVGPFRPGGAAFPTSERC